MRTALSILANAVRVGVVTSCVTKPADQGLPAFPSPAVVLQAAALKDHPHADVIIPSVIRIADHINCRLFNIGPRLQNKIALAVSEPNNSTTPPQKTMIPSSC
jgi:hypothetical protein